MIVSVLDQGLYSAASLLAVFSVSRSFEAAAFGHFVLSYAASTLVLAVTRQYFSVDLARTAGEIASVHSRRFRRYLTAALAISPVYVVIVLVSGVGIDRQPGTYADLLYAMVALSTPFAVTHDISRYLLASRTSNRVIVPDGVRLTGLAACFVLGPSMGAVGFCLVWLGSHVVSALVAILLADRRPLIRDWMSALSPRWGIRTSVTLVGLLSAAVPLITAWIVGLAFSVEELGAWRGATMLFGPLNTLIMFMDFSILSRTASMNATLRLVFLKKITVFALAVAALWGLVVHLLPDQIGHLVLGDSWDSATQFFTIIAVEYCFLCMTSALLLEYKISGLSRQMVVIKIASSSLMLAGTIAASMSAVSVVYVAVASLLGAFSGFVLSVHVLVRKRA